MNSEKVRLWAQNYIADDLAYLGFYQPSTSYDAQNIPSAALFGGTDEEFTRRAYEIVLNRQVDRSGFISTMEELRAFRTSRVMVIRRIIDSEEAEVRGLRPGLARIEDLVELELAKAGPFRWAARRTWKSIRKFFHAMPKLARIL